MSKIKTRDIDIRNSLHAILSRDFKDDPETLILDELGLCQGEARVDVAVVNGSLHGYEIKSESDTLERLPHQVKIYSKVLDTVTIITGDNYVNKLNNIIPSWWGIERVINFGEYIQFEVIKEPERNLNVDPYSLVQLLWRDEALELLREYGYEKGYLSKSRKEIWKRLAESIPLNDLQDQVRRILKYRSNWRVD